MNMIYEKYGINISISEGSPSILVLEAENFYSEFIGDLYRQYNGITNSIIISNNNNEMNISKKSEVIWNPYLIDCNDRKIINKLYQELNDYSKEYLQEKSSDVISKVYEYLDQLSSSTPYSIAYNLDIDFVGLYKLFDLKMNYIDGDILEHISNYIKISHRLCNKELFIFIALKTFLTNTQLSELYNDLKYENIYFLDIENYYKNKADNEKIIIVDKDCCIIEP